MSDDERRPWWYSGDETPDDQTDQRTGDSAGESGAASGLGDWTAVLSGAVRMVDWATSTVMAPHAEHDDPTEHPTCVVCRTLTIVGDAGGLMPGSGGAPAAPPSEPRHAPLITWIPVRDEQIPGQDEETKPPR